MDNLTIIKKEIFELKNKLQKLNEEKEKFFKEKEELKKEIKKEIGQLKGIKSRKSLAQKAISESKEKRHEYSKQIYDLIKQIKELNEQKRNFFQKFNLRNSPEELKEKIDQLELSIETQAYTFEKERKVMEQIKKLKKIYNDALQGSELLNKINKISLQIDELKRKSQDFNQIIEKELKEVKDYEEFKENIKKINYLRNKQQEYFQKFLEAKREFLNANTGLKNKLLEVKNLQRNIYEETKKERERTSQSILNKKTIEVEEKLRKRQKLTTEDLIVFQGQR